MSSDVDLVLMDKDRVSRSLNRMAHEIIEQNITDRPVILFGINKRGYAVAQALADILKPMFESDVKSIQLFLKNGDSESFLKELQDVESENSFSIVVDDVIFSGRTMFSALKKITDRFAIKEIHTAVLIDRGHRKFPVKAEYYGMELPTKLNEHVSVIVEEMNVKKVILTNPGS